MKTNENNNNKRKKDYLNLYQNALRKEKEILDEIHALKADQRFPEIASKDIPQSFMAEDLREYTALLNEQINLLKQERLERALLRIKIEKSIRSMQNEEEQRVLYLRYIAGLKWEDIEIEMAYSLRKVHYLHNEALENFQIP